MPPPAQVAEQLADPGQQVGRGDLPRSAPGSRRSSGRQTDPSWPGSRVVGPVREDDLEALHPADALEPLVELSVERHPLVGARRCQARKWCSAVSVMTPSRSKIDRASRGRGRRQPARRRNRTGSPKWRNSTAARRPRCTSPRRRVIVTRNREPRRAAGRRAASRRAAAGARRRGRRRRRGGRRSRSPATPRCRPSRRCARRARVAVDVVEVHPGGRDEVAVGRVGVARAPPRPRSGCRARATSPRS